MFKQSHATVPMGLPVTDTTSQHDGTTPPQNQSLDDGQAQQQVPSAEAYLSPGSLQQTTETNRIGRMLLDK